MTVIANQPGSPSAAVQGLLRRYGHHANASYILFQQCEAAPKKAQATQQPGETTNGPQPWTGVAGKDIHDMASRGSPSTPAPGPLTGLVGFTGLADMYGFSGLSNVLTNSTPEAQKGHMDAPAAALGVPLIKGGTWVGYIAKGTGLDGKEELVFAFRGSSVGPDWATNLMGAAPTSNLYEKGIVHKGFYNMLHEVPEGDQLKSPVDVIDSVLEPYINEFKTSSGSTPLPRMITVGHSLGGALAVLAAVHIRRHIMSDVPSAPADVVVTDLDSYYTQKQLQSYTYAAPRVGDEKLCDYFAEELHIQALQMVNVEDPVPHLGPNSWKELKIRTARSLLGMLNKAAPAPAAAPGAAPQDASAAASDTAKGQGHYADARLTALEHVLAELGHIENPKELGEAVRKELDDGNAELAAAAKAAAMAAAANVVATANGAPAAAPAARLPAAQSANRLHYIVFDLVTGILKQSWANNPGLRLEFDTQKRNIANHYLTTYLTNIADCKQA